MYRQSGLVRIQLTTATKATKGQRWARLSVG